MYSDQAITVDMALKRVNKSTASKTLRSGSNRRRTLPVLNPSDQFGSTQIIQFNS